VSSRLPDSRHACSAWNQVVHVVGSTPGIDTAYSGVVQLPFIGNDAG
jgi:hypothetical protein